MEKGEEGLDKAYDDTVGRIENQRHGIHELAKTLKGAFLDRLREKSRGAEACLSSGTWYIQIGQNESLPWPTISYMMSSCAGLVTVDTVET
jgi:hypothetical protein